MGRVVGMGALVVQGEGEVEGAGTEVGRVAVGVVVAVAGKGVEERAAKAEGVGTDKWRSSRRNSSSFQWK